MKVKVDDKVYSGDKEPVMVILTDQDKENIKNMDPSCTKYCVYPADYRPGYIKVWMEEPPSPDYLELSSVLAKVKRRGFPSVDETKSGIVSSRRTWFQYCDEHGRTRHRIRLFRGTQPRGYNEIYMSRKLYICDQCGDISSV